MTLTLLPHRAIGEQRLRRLRLLRRGLPRPVLAGPRRVRLRERHAGHDLGDRLLVEVATGCTRSLRRTWSPGPGRRVRGARRVRRRPPRRREPGPAHPGGLDPALPGGRAGGEISVRSASRWRPRPPPYPPTSSGRRTSRCRGRRRRGGGRVAVFDPDRDAGESARAALLAGMPDGGGARRVPAALPAARAPRRRRVRGAEALCAGSTRARAARSGPVRRGGGAQRCHRAAGPLDPHRGVPAGRRLVARAGAPGAVRDANVSPVQLAEPGRWAQVTDVMELTSLPPWQLQLEITEQTVLRDEGRRPRRSRPCGPPASGSPSTTSAPATRTGLVAATPRARPQDRRLLRRRAAAPQRRSRRPLHRRSVDPDGARLRPGDYCRMGETAEQWSS